MKTQIFAIVLALSSNATVSNLFAAEPDAGVPATKPQFGQCLPPEEVEISAKSISAAFGELAAFVADKAEQTGSDLKKRGEDLKTTTIEQKDALDRFAHRKLTEAMTKYLEAKKGAKKASKELLNEMNVRVNDLVETTGKQKDEIVSEFKASFEETQKRIAEEKKNTDAGTVIEPNICVSQ